MRLYKTLFFTIAFPVLALAGGMSTGGGTVIVCREANGQIRSVSMLDLYEGIERFDYAIVTTNATSAQTQFEAALGKIKDPFYRAKINEISNDVISRIKFLKEGVVLAPTTDLGNDYGVVIPDGCELSAVGFYEADGTLKVSKTLYKYLSQTDRAAFVLHEAIYKFVRDAGKQDNSADSRNLTAMLFASNMTADNFLNLLKASIGQYSLENDQLKPYKHVYRLILNNDETVNFKVDAKYNGVSLWPEFFTQCLKFDEESAYDYCKTELYNSLGSTHKIKIEKLTDLIVIKPSTLVDFGQMSLFADFYLSVGDRILVQEIFQWTRPGQYFLIYIARAMPDAVIPLL